MRSESATPAARWAASNTDVQSGRGPPGSGASIGSRICPAACEERASARVRSWPREKGRRISGSYAETATRSAPKSLEASSISLLLPTPGSPSTITAVGRRSPGARATAARTTSSSCVRPKNPVTPATLRVPRSRLDLREVPHDTCGRRPYRPSHRCGPGNGLGRRKGDAMHAQVVTFGLNGITEEQFREAAGADTPTFANLPGLLAKIWLRDPETNTYGGLYLWDDQEAYERYIKGEVFNAIKADQNLKNVEARDFGVFEDLSSLTMPKLRAV